MNSSFFLQASSRTEKLVSFSSFLETNPSIDQLLSHEETLDFIGSSSINIGKYISKEGVEKLLSFIIEEPENSSDLKSFRFPFVASKILSLDYAELLDVINENPELLEKITRFVESKPKSNTTAVVYYTSLCEDLLSRDNSLIKTLHKTCFFDLFQHFDNHNFNGLMISILEKSFKSKKTRENSRIMIKRLVFCLNDIKSAANCQIILSASLSEDEIYEEIKTYLGQIFEIAEKNDEKLGISGLKLIKSLLEKEKDLKIIDEEAWGSSEMLENLEAHIRIFNFSKNLEEIKKIGSSMGYEIEPAGEKTLILIEILTLMSEMNQESLNSAILSNNLLLEAVGVFEKHPWNSILQVLFINFVTSALRSSIKRFLSSLLLEIVQKYCLSPSSSSIHNRGIQPFCWKIASLLQSTCEIYEDMQDFLEGHPWWKEILTRISEKTKLEETVDPIIAHRKALTISKSDASNMDI